MIVYIAFILINAINSVDPIDRINPGVLNCSALQLKDNLNDPTNSEMTFWGKKEELFGITGIYWHLQIFHEVWPRNKFYYLRGHDY